MVITSPTLFARARGGDRYWKRRRVLSMSAHFFGRKKNCYSIAIKYVHRALYNTLARRLKRRDDRKLWDTRISAACTELGTKYLDMKPLLDDSSIAINRSILQNLAIWEPRSFRPLHYLPKPSKKRV